MTPEQKEERRAKKQARRQLESVFRKIVVRQLGLCSTERQIRAAVKLRVDRYYAEQVRPAAQRIERQLLEEAEKRLIEAAD